MNYYKVQKEHIILSDFCIKPLLYDHHQNLNPILIWVRRKKNFLKVWVPRILEFVRKIMICESSHIIFRDNLSFVGSFAHLNTTDSIFINCGSSHIERIDL